MGKYQSKKSTLFSRFLPPLSRPEIKFSGGSTSSKQTHFSRFPPEILKSDIFIKKVCFGFSPGKSQNNGVCRPGLSNDLSDKFSSPGRNFSPGK